MKTEKIEEIFESELLPLFVAEMGDVHYTWAMFKNLARPANTQDRRLESSYWEKKAHAGQECCDMWDAFLECDSKELREEKLLSLVSRLSVWYNKESAMGLIENENEKSKGAGRRQARKTIAADLEYLDKHCPNSSPWTIKTANSLLEERETDNAIISGIKSSFLRLYISQDEDGLSLWDKEKKWFYKNKKKIDAFVQMNNDGDPKAAMLKLLKFTDQYEEDYRSLFGK